MYTLTIINTRPVHRNVAIASSLDDIQPARSRSPPTAMDRQPDPQTHTPRTTLKPRNRYNWPTQSGSDQTEDRDNWAAQRPNVGLA